MGARPTIIFVFLGLSLAACDENKLDRPYGHYEGVVYQKADQNISHVTVTADLSYPLAYQGVLAIKTKDRAPLFTLQMTNVTDQGFTISFPAPYNLNFDLKKTDSQCYTRPAMPLAHFCYTENKILLEIMDNTGAPLFTLSGDRFAPPNPFPMENPKTYAIRDAIGIALQKNFNTRMEYENLVQANATAKQAYLNLIPHLSFSTILASLVPSIVSFLGDISDLAPFLLPSRLGLLQAKGFLAAAELDALELMRADLAAQVEGLAYNLERDEEIAGFYSSLLDRAKTGLQKASALESAGQIAEGSADQMQTVADSLELDLSVVRLMIEGDKEALAQVLGLNNPKAVQSIEFGQEELPLEIATTLDPAPLAQTALDRSFELREMDHLIQATEAERSTDAFAWLDPKGDPSRELGLGMIETIVIEKSAEKQLQIRKAQLQQLIAQKVFHTVDQYNLPIQILPMLNQNLALQSKRLERLLSAISPGADLTKIDVEGIFQDYLGAAMRRAASVAEFRVARSTLDRVLLQGYYVDQQPRPPAN